MSLVLEQGPTLQSPMNTQGLVNIQREGQGGALGIQTIGDGQIYVFPISC